MPIRIPMAFMQDLYKQGPLVAGWVALLMVVHGLLPMASWAHQRPAQWMLGCFMLSALSLMGLHARFGMVRLLGVGHFWWFPAMAYLYGAIDTSPQGAYEVWVLVAVCTGSLSLLIDVVDLGRWLRGERGTMV